MMKYLIIYIVLFHGTLAFSNTIVFDLISKSNCVVETNILKNCKLGPIQIASNTSEVSTIPYKTIIKTIVEGDCKSIYPIQMSVVDTQNNNSSSITAPISVLNAHQIEFRTRNRKPVENIEIRDASQYWTEIAIFSNSCLSKLEITLNQPDINSSDEASEIIRKISEKIKDNNLHSKVLSELRSFQIALKTIYALFELTDQSTSNISISELAKKKSEYLDFFDRIRQSKELNLDRSEKKLLSKLEDFIDELSTNESSRGNSFSQFLSESDQKLILTLLERIDKVENQDLTTIENLTKKLSQSCLEFSETKILLKPWVTSDNWLEFKDVTLICEKLSDI